MSVAWYYARGGERRGPMSWDELRAAARAGSFGAGDLVWTPGYGAEWRRASTLDALSPPPTPAGDAPPGPADRAAPAAPSPAASAGAAPPPFRVRIVERSPFAPETPDHRAPDPHPRCLFSLRTAWANTRVVLMRPFSLGRWLAFSFAVLLMLLGAQPEWTLVPAASPTLRAAADRAGLGTVLESRLFSFPERLAEAVRAAPAAAAPEAVFGPILDDLGESLRDASARLVAWTASARPRDLAGVGAGAALLLLVFCAMRAWFLARSWTLMLGRVYRRDEPVLLSWFDARRPSRTVFRGVLLARLALVAMHAAFAAACVLALARVPAGSAGRGEVYATLVALGAPLLADAVAMGLLRDFAVPRVLLLRRPFGAAVRESLAALGPWYLRYLLLLGLLAAVVWTLLGKVLALAFGDAASRLPALVFLLSAALATPWQLLRCLWSLDLLFRIDPAARALVPPRAFAEAIGKRPRPPEGRAP